MGKWTPQQRARFKRTMAKKLKAKPVRGLEIPLDTIPERQRTIVKDIVLAQKVQQLNNQLTRVSAENRMLRELVRHYMGHAE